MTLDVEPMNARGPTMTLDVESGEVVQILRTGHRHWNTVSTIVVKHPEVQVFDNLYMCEPTVAKALIASLLATEEPAIKLSFIIVQMHCGGYNCGLYAIVFATALVFREQPGGFLFD